MLSAQTEVPRDMCRQRSVAVDATGGLPTPSWSMEPCYLVAANVVGGGLFATSECVSTFCVQTVVGSDLCRLRHVAADATGGHPTPT